MDVRRSIEIKNKIQLGMPIIMAENIAAIATFLSIVSIVSSPASARRLQRTLGTAYVTARPAHNAPQRPHGSIAPFSAAPTSGSRAAIPTVERANVRGGWKAAGPIVSLADS